MSGLARFFLPLFLFFVAFNASAQMQLDGSAPKVEAQLIAEDESVQPGRPFWVALKMNIIPDWHVYWRNPGDSGMATHIAWNLPADVQVGPIVWPTPSRIEIAPLVNYGFSDQVLLLTQITPPDDLTDSTLQLRAKADWLVCHEVCIPESANLELDLPVTMDVPLKSAWSSAFTATRKKVPQPFKGDVVVTKKNDQDFTVTLRDIPLSAVETPVEAYFFSGDGALVTHKMNHGFVQSGRDFTITVPYSTTTIDHPSTVEGDVWVRTTQNDYSFAIDTQFTAPPAPAQTATVATKAPAPAVGIGLFKSFLLAFMGGILLNLMPCVFPVLSIKALGLVQKSQHGDRKQIITGGLVYTGGVLVSFAILGALLLVVKTGGHNVDWGMQLQSPLFVTLMSLVLFLIGYTLIGAITFGGNMMGIGQSLTHKAGHVGTFFTGALAVIVATPCTAPFMGGALFYGFTQPWYIAISILLALGLGLALPYLLICFFPGALRFLPKPGIWMEHFKQFLAFPMFAAAIWLIWVLGQQVGADGVLRALIAMLIVAFALWVWRSIQRDTHQNAWHYCKAFIVAMCILYVVSLMYDQSQSLTQMTATATATDEKAQFEPFTPERLAQLRSENKPVFVNMTAAWCITCLVNERTALSTPEVKKFFADQNITYLKGDWTNQDPAISAFLQEHGRNGVPLYAFYAPGQEAKILPQILSARQIISDLTVKPSPIPTP